MRNRLLIPKEEVQARIRQLIEQGGALLEEPGNWPRSIDRWRNRGLAALATSFAGESETDEFVQAATPNLFLSRKSEDRERYYLHAINAGVRTLEALMDRLEFAIPPHAHGDSAEPRPLTTGRRTVFVVHGRDEGLREQVARLLERLSLEPLILMEQPNRGKTLIEKFEDGALDVGFAVVLLTPDDHGRSPESAEWPEQANRARQNVILELGYFMGKLGRSHVVALYRDGTELPSDIHGLGYVPVDEGGAWKFRLAQELAAAGYEVDLNRLVT